MKLRRACRVAAALAIAVACAVACAEEFPGYGPPSAIPVGTWGGANAGMIVTDTIAHVHLGCTFGNLRAPVALDAAGRFDAAGSYVLRAYPVTVGPSLPARFSGSVNGSQLTFTVTVTDTVEKRTVTLGPATLTLGTEPRMGPCPICRVVPVIR
jgi:hypothetical protein